MQEKIILSANEIDRLRREAKQIKKSSGMQLSKALDILAQRQGYANWSLLHKEFSRAPKEQGPTSQGLQRACIEFINTLSDDAVRGFCKSGPSMWAPAQEVQSGNFGRIKVLGPADELSTKQYAQQNRLLRLARFDGLGDWFVFDTDDDYEEDENGNPIETSLVEFFTPERGRAALLSIDYGGEIDGVLDALEQYLTPPEEPEYPDQRM